MWNKWQKNENEISHEIKYNLHSFIMFGCGLWITKHKHQMYLTLLTKVMHVLTHIQHYSITEFIKTWDKNLPNSSPEKWGRANLYTGLPYIWVNMVYILMFSFLQTDYSICGQTFGHLWSAVKAQNLSWSTTVHNVLILGQVCKKCRIACHTHKSKLPEIQSTSAYI